MFSFIPVISRVSSRNIVIILQVGEMEILINGRPWRLFMQYTEDLKIELIPTPHPDLEIQQRGLRASLLTCQAQQPVALGQKQNEKRTNR